MVKKTKKAAEGFQFVNISNPDDAVKHRRQVRSHAARRRAATEQGEEETPSTTSQGRDQGQSHATTTRTEEDLDADLPWDLTLVPTKPLGATQPDPLSALSPATADPFSSWVRPLTPFEGSLLKYCE